MKDNLKRMAGYYRPYMGTFWADMFFAFTASVISLMIPLAVRYITSNIADMDGDRAVRQVLTIGAVLVVLIILQFVSNYYITFIGHVMGGRRSLSIIRSCPLPFLMSRRWGS